MGLRAGTAGTKNFLKLSVKRCVGEFCVSASLTSVTTLASTLSVDRRVTSISINPRPLMMPANTRLAALGLARDAASSCTGRLSTGILSPATGA
nr:hypothetical protein [Novosphingobium colocasiae]